MQSIIPSRPYSFIAAALMVLLLLLPSVSSAKAFQKKSTVMGTSLELTVEAENEEKAEEAFSAAISEMERVEALMSEWMEGSPVSEVNRNAGKRPVEVPAELFDVIEAARILSFKSNGAFDISWAAMKGLWDFRQGRERLPTEEEIAERLPLVDFRRIKTDLLAHTVFLETEGMAIGLGAIAKGYAVDRAMKALLVPGVTGAIIKAGGDMRVQGGPWEIGIKDPRRLSSIMARLKLSDISISTSGDYERFFIKDGILYHHIMDPKTGRPARGTRSVTVIGPDTMTTDALSTAIFVLGPEKGLKLAEELPGIEAIIIDSFGKLHSTGGIELK